MLLNNNNNNNHLSLADYLAIYIHFFIRYNLLSMLCSVDNDNNNNQLSEGESAGL